jgi:uncharacterized protein
MSQRRVASAMCSRTSWVHRSARKISFVNNNKPKKSAPEADVELPIAFVPCSNGEMYPLRVTERDEKAVAEFLRRADENARRAGLSRRDFIRSAAGMATALSVINVAYGCGKDNASTPGGGADAGYNLPPDADVDANAACSRLLGNEFIFDVQVHHVDAGGDWRKDAALERSIAFPFMSCGETDRMVCLGVESFVREVFVRSDTAVACLTGLPAEPTKDPLSLSKRIETQGIVERLAGSPRLLLHANVLPERKAEQLDAMQAAFEQYGKRIAAWKVYPNNWRFDDPAIGIPFIEKARALGVKTICAHRGISGDGGAYDAFSSPREMFKVAQQFPDVAFLVYHSGWEGGTVEGPYNPANANPHGIDRMVRAMEEFPATNVYAELGSTFRSLMTKPDQLAHGLGKLLKTLGEDRVLWGTDCIWYGSPQEQIAALRAFEIPAALQQAHGYPALTQEVKKKILGLNGAKVYGVDPATVHCAIKDDDIAKIKTASAGSGERGWPIRDYGPRTRRELFAMLRGGFG